MENDKDPTSPATTSEAYDVMFPRWALMSDVLGGTETMRDAGETRLPKHALESAQNYRERQGVAVLLNMTEATLNSLSGRPFSEDIRINDDVPEAMAVILDNVDLEGNNLGVFLRAWFREGVAKAFAHVLVDFPRPAPRGDGLPRTVADDQAEGLRPYWVLVNPEHVISARSEMVQGREVLQHVRILETYVAPNGFAEVAKQRIRVLEPGRTQIWEPVRDKRQRKEVWQLTDEWETGLSYVPMVTFYAHRDSFLLGKPPLLDLAHLNVAHWQSDSDQRHILTVTRFPILAMSGASKEESTNVAIGPNQILANADPSGKIYYVEHTGAAIEAGRQDLKDLEDAMAQYGAEFLKKRPGSTTATARALDSAESISALSSMVLVFEDAVAQALSFTAEWLGIGSTGGTIKLCNEFQLDGEDGGDLEFLRMLRESNDISREAFVQAAVDRGVLPKEFDAAADWKLIVAGAKARAELPPPPAPAQLNKPDGPPASLGTGGPAAKAGRKPGS